MSEGMPLEEVNNELALRPPVFCADEVKSLPRVPCPNSRPAAKFAGGLEASAKPRTRLLPASSIKTELNLSIATPTGVHSVVELAGPPWLHMLFETLSDWPKTSSAVTSPGFPCGSGITNGTGL